MHGDDFVCLSDDDGLKHIDSLLKSKYTAKDMGTLGFEDSDVKSLLLLNRVFRAGTFRLDSTWTSSMNQDAVRTLKQWSTPRKNYKTNWCWSEDGVRF